jgi:hypothetical protein
MDRVVAAVAAVADLARLHGSRLCAVVVSHLQWLRGGSLVEVREGR